MSDTDFSPAIPRWFAFFFTLLASPLLACIPYACGCFSRDSRLFKAFYLQGMGMGAIGQGCLLLAIILGAGDACTTICTMHASIVKDAKGSFQVLNIKDCSGSCRKSYPAGIAIAIILGLFGVTMVRDPIPVFGGTLVELLAKRAESRVPGILTPSTPDQNAPSSTNNAIPIGAGAIALVAVGALMFAKFGYNNKPKRNKLQELENNPHAGKVQRGFMAEIEDNFKLPQNILKSTAAAVNMGQQQQLFPAPPLTFQDRQANTFSNYKVQLTNSNNSKHSNTGTTNAPSSDDDENDDALEYQESEYAPRKFVQAPRRKHSITLDIDANQLIQQNRLSQIKNVHPGMSKIPDDPESGSQSESSLLRSSNGDGSNVFLTASQGIFESANSSMTSVSVSSSKVMKYKVVEPWIPQRFDELDLHVGEIVHVYQTYKDGWCEGCVDKAEDEEGMFPRVCLGEFALSIGDLDTIDDGKGELGFDGGIRAAVSSEAVSDTEKQMMALKDAILSDIEGQVDRPPLEMVDVGLETPRAMSDLDETPRAPILPAEGDEVPNGFDMPLSGFAGDD
ncbi:UNVERIFIED_CONTAM: hypothetical protein HDU68_001452 [Siphonaria sp. JEL0065]|nr:hypothetical protein HDU68_001452 [Siphonaria sp. JEL0065]